MSKASVDASSVLLLPRGSRNLLLGKTGGGKSTLEEEMFYRFMEENPTARALFIDTKPRFKGAHLLNGLPASPLYKRWGYGSFVPDSWVLPMKDPLKELKMCFDLGGRIAIAQSGKLEDMTRLSNCITAFYDGWGARVPRLLILDEVADFFDRSPFAKEGAPIREAIRNGRERNFAMLACSQRPQGLPKHFLSQVSRAYLFELESEEDLKHLQKNGLPGVTPATEEFEFFFFDRLNKRNPLSGQKYILDLEAA
jgi:hypothetical protein